MPFFTVRVKLEVETELRREIYAPKSISFFIYNVFLYTQHVFNKRYG